MKNPSLKTISEEDLEKFRNFLARSMGLHFPKQKEKELESKLMKIAKTLGMDDLKSCLKFLTEINISRKHIVTLAKDLSVGETYFFRHEQTFKALEKNLLPEIIAEKGDKNKNIKIWSSACCTGEEPYSLAILLKKLIYGIERWQIEIVGTDINLEFLDKAKKGNYREWSFRNIPQKIKEEYFRAKGDGSFVLKEDILKMVSFEYLNLVDESFPSIPQNLYEMDLILCNNVLIYFTPEAIPKVIDRFSKTLKEGGWLIVSTVEAPFIEHPSLVSKKVGDIFLFKKESHEQKTAVKPSKKPSGTSDQQTKSGQRQALLQHSFLEKPKTEPLDAKKEAAEKSSPQTILQLENEFLSLKETDRFQEKREDLIRLVRELANQGKIAKATDWCTLALRFHSLDPMLLYLYGTLLQESGMKEEALQVYKKCLFLAPSFVMCHFSLGGMCLITGDEKAAKKYFRNVLELLKNYSPDDILPGIEDLTAERIKIIAANLIKENSLG